MRCRPFPGGVRRSWEVVRAFGLRQKVSYQCRSTVRTLVDRHEAPPKPALPQRGRGQVSSRRADLGGAFQGCAGTSG
eukprot:15436266-Alexandrium_andersonii.AAC.1